MTGYCEQYQWNNGTIIADLYFDDLVLYPNPYITVTPKGYTKHYFAGTQRISTAMGGGGFCNMIVPMDNLTNHPQEEKTIEKESSDNHNIKQNSFKYEAE